MPFAAKMSLLDKIFAAKSECAKITPRNDSYRARVAQWIEHLPPEQGVTGSNPVAGTFLCLKMAIARP